MRVAWMPSRNTFTFGISLLFVLLFVYAGTDKLMDLENFQVQLEQTPILRPYSGWLSLSVVGIELAAAGLLIVQHTRQIGLYLSFGLMVLFTTYLFLVLNFSDTIPCSCGGVISGMGWNDHILFYSTLMVLALIGIFLNAGKHHKKETT